jgi:ribose transport system substrate-binding protein
MININRRSLLVLAGSSLATTALTSNGFAESGKRLRVAFANYDDEASFGALVLRGMKHAADEHRELDVLLYDNKKDGAHVMEVARTLATLRPNVFVEYNSIVPQVNVQVSRLMKEAGVPILSIQVRVPETPLFAVDNALSGYDSGRAAADAAKRRWPGEQPVGLLIGLPEGGPMFLERTDNAIRGVREVFPNIVLEQQSSKEQAGVARQLTTDYLTKNPQKKVIIWAHVDAMGLAALTASRNSGRDGDVVIAATGGDAAAFPEIRKPNSPFIGTFSFFPEFWGNDVLPLAVRLANGETIPDITRPTKQLFVDAGNIDQFYPRQ